MKTICLPAGAEYVQFDELAHLIAMALFPLGDSATDGEMMAYGFACINLEAELLQAVQTGALPVKDPLTFGPHSYPVGNALQTALVSVGDLRAYLAGRPISIEVAPAKDTATPAPSDAPVVALSAVSGSESDKAGPLPLITGDIAFCFAGLHWKTEKAWKAVLGKGRDWTEECVAAPAGGRGRGVAPKLWNPVLLAAKLVERYEIPQKSVRARFQNVQNQRFLGPWLDAWKTYEADNLSTE